MDQSDPNLISTQDSTDPAFFHLFQNNPIAMWVYDRETLGFVDVNNAAVFHYGYSRDEFLAMSLADLRPPEDVPGMLNVVRNAKGAIRVGGEWRHKRKDGTIVDVVITAHDVVYLGQPARLVLAQDITERKRTEAANSLLLEQIRRERERLDNLVSRVPAVVWEFWNEPDETLQRINFVSSHVETQLGYPLANWLNIPKFWLTVLHPEDRERAQAEVREQYNSGTGGVSQFRCVAEDGQIVWVEASTAVIFDVAGNKIGLRGLNMNITERMLAANALRESEERYRLVARATNDVIWDWDLLTGDLRHSDAILSVFAYEDGNVGHDRQWWFERTHPDDRDRAVAELWAVIVGGGAYWSGEYRFQRGDGSWATVLDRSYLMRDADGKPLRMIGSMLDITEQTRTQDALRFLAEASETLSASLDYETTLSNLTRLLVPYIADYCAIDILQESGAVDRLAVAHADPEKERILRRMQQCYHTAPNSPHPIRDVLFSGIPQLQAQVTEDYLVAAAVDDEMLSSWHALGPKSFMAVPMKVRGRVFGAMSFVASESERVYTEGDLELAMELARRASVAVDNARLYREIQRADGAKDEFLAMLGHELRNPLGAIANAMELIRLRGKVDPALQRTLDVVERQSHHLARLVDDLLDVSRITHGKIDLRTETVALAFIVTLAVQAVQPLLDSRGHEMHVLLPLNPVWLNVDPIRIAQVISNLLSNAAKYTEPGGRVTLTAEVEAGFAVIHVRDTGVGISGEMLNNVFDLFTQADRSLDRAQGGLGIGLTVVKNLVQLHGGIVDAKSDGAGTGSEFTVRLPALAQGPAHVATAGELKATHENEPRLNILLVEDNVDAARTLAEILGMWGYSVRSAHDGPSALQMVPQYHADVVLLDIGLPGMDGYEVARQLHENHLAPGATLVALTGYGQEEDQRRSAEAGFHHHLVKPVDFGALEKLLDGLKANR